MGISDDFCELATPLRNDGNASVFVMFAAVGQPATLGRRRRHQLTAQITSFMRNVANYTDFADIMLIRRLVSITYLIPLPADAVVTPITFLVPKRTGPDACRGFLQ